MMSPENDSDVPEHVSLSTSKRQVIGRQKDVAKELSQAKLKQKQHNRERDRQLKEQSLKKWAPPVADSEEESSAKEDEEAKDPRLLPDHLFVAAFNQPPPAPKTSVPKDATPKTQKRRRKRTDLTPKDQIVGSRTIRTLMKGSDLAAARRTLPSSSASKFSTRALNTKGSVNLSRLRGWQRKAVNTGVLKPANGPAAHFVRT